MRANPRSAGPTLVLLAAGCFGLGRADATGGLVLPPVQQGERPSVRDPFRPPDAGSVTPRPPGLAGVGVTEAVIRGIVRVRIPTGAESPPEAPGWAILESLTGEGFVAAPGDHLLDGVLAAIEAGGVVFWLEGDPDRPVHRPLARRAAPEEER